MVVKEFLAELEKTQSTFVWQYLHDNRIRGFLRSDGTRTAFDPIAAVALVRNGQSVRSDSVDFAREVGLSVVDTEAITDAADDMLWKQIDGQTVLDGYCEWIRDGIALATGLEPYEPLSEANRYRLEVASESANGREFSRAD